MSRANKFLFYYVSREGNAVHNYVRGETNIFNDRPGGSLPFNYVQGLNFPSWSSKGVYNY